MTPEQFCYWLQGFQETTNYTPSDSQWKIIVNHLEQVFNKKTPSLIPSHIKGPWIAQDLKPIC